MRLALDEARQAAREDEVPVGAVLVAADGRLLARAHNRPVACTIPRPMPRSWPCGPPGPPAAITVWAAGCWW